MTPFATDDAPRTDEAGFSLIELMVAAFLLAVISGTMVQGMLGLKTVHDRVANRTEMHSGVRNATELMQQEVGQAGRVSLGPAAVTLDAAAGATIATVAPSTAGLFAGEYLVVGVGQLQETVRVTAVTSATTISVDPLDPFQNAHDDSPVASSGAFAAGVIPTTMASGSTGNVLKLVGDINDDSNMTYVEYTCDTATGRLFRNAVAWNAVAKAAPTVEQILLDNILPNPDGTPCFTYQQKTVDIGGVPTTFVIGVAITLTVRTQEVDENTGQFTRETKALLNVSPRNVFNAWQLASLNYDDRVQPLPASVVALLPPS